jgi:polyribonucleotide nucleotidyltransferase
VVGSSSESKFTVKSADVVKIIGKGGYKIRELEEESGAHIPIGEKCDENFHKHSIGS